jgi:hypothetical protein
LATIMAAMPIITRQEISSKTTTILAVGEESDPILISLLQPISQLEGLQEIIIPLEHLLKIPILKMEDSQSGRSNLSLA